MKRMTERQKARKRERAKESKRQNVIGSMIASSCMALSQPQLFITHTHAHPHVHTHTHTLDARAPI